MTAERESMTLQEMDAPALGVEERRDEAPRAGASHARTYPASRLGPSPRTLRPRHPETRPASRSRLDQPTRHFHNRRNESVNRNRRCLKVVDRFRGASGPAAAGPDAGGWDRRPLSRKDCGGARSIRPSVSVLNR